MKVCSKCGISKIEDSYWNDKSCTVSKKQSQCKACMYEKSKRYRAKNRDAQRKRMNVWHSKNKERTENNRLQLRYGITTADRRRMHKEQEGRCPCCGYEEPQEARGNEKLHVDHDHETGEVRGLLCGNCNKALGIVGESRNTLSNMIKYLEKYGNFL